MRGPLVAAALALAALPLPAAAAQKQQPPAAKTSPARGTPAPAAVLARYEAALNALREPATLTFDYLLTQGGTRSAEQTHRVFRHGTDERDETLDPQAGRVVLTRIFHGRRNRYTVHALAPRASQYAFLFLGVVKNQRHVDYLFATVPHAPGAFVVGRVTIDGVRFLPLQIAFTTKEHGGRGTVDFGARERRWVVTAAQAQARERDGIATERIAFSAYRFPTQLPPSTFSPPRPLPTFPPA